MHIVMYATALRHWGKLNPKSLTKAVESPAGTELAMMGVARGLARKGHRVTVFAQTEGGTFDGVEYISADLALPLLTSLESDVVVSWQDASVFLHPLKTKLRVLMSQSAHLNLGQATDKVDRYFGISRFSAQTLLDSDAYAQPEKMWVTRNGILLQRFPLDYTSTEEDVRFYKKPHSLLWTSSPDRGLHHLVDIFAKVREQVPDAALTVCYNFDKTLQGFKSGMPGSAFVRNLEYAAQLKKTPGVRVLNHVSQPEIARLLTETAVLAYPCDPIRVTETYCIAVTEAMAAGCACVLSDADCLPENYGQAAVILPRPIDHDAWAETIVSLMLNPGAQYALAQKGLALAALCDFDMVAGEWADMFAGYLAGRETETDLSLASIQGR